jgi:hypothetical protein
MVLRPVRFIGNSSSLPTRSALLQRGVTTASLQSTTAIEGSSVEAHGKPIRTGSFVPFTVIGECFMNSAMQLNLLKFTKQPNQCFAGALFAFSLVGSIHPHYMSHVQGRSHANLLYSHQIQKSNDDYWYTPPRSPAFNDLLGG